jgi:hypothetical protein
MGRGLPGRYKAQGQLPLLLGTRIPSLIVVRLEEVGPPARAVPLAAGTSRRVRSSKIDWSSRATTSPQRSRRCMQCLCTGHGCEVVSEVLAGGLKTRPPRRDDPAHQPRPSLEGRRLHAVQGEEPEASVPRTASVLMICSRTRLSCVV